MSEVSEALAGNHSDNPSGLRPRVPETCLICGADYLGGHELPGNQMRPGLRVFYRCGASFSIWKDLGLGAYQMLLKNCNCEENQKLYAK